MCAQEKEKKKEIQETEENEVGECENHEKAKKQTCIREDKRKSEGRVEQMPDASRSKKGSQREKESEEQDSTKRESYCET